MGIDGDRNNDTIDPVKLLIAYHAAIQRLDFDAIESMIHPNAEYKSAGVGSLKGREAILAAFRAYFAVYPDQVAMDDSVVATACDTAIAVWHLQAKNLETGEMSRRRGSEEIRFDDAGKILNVIVRDN